MDFKIFESNFTFTLNNMTYYLKDIVVEVLQEELKKILQGQFGVATFVVQDILDETFFKCFTSTPLTEYAKYARL